MNPLFQPLVLALIGFCILAEIAYQLSFKLGAARAGKADNLILGVATQPMIWAGVVIWSVEVAAWVMVLQHVPLSLAYPIMTLNFAAIPLAGVVLLRERLSRSQIAGAALVAFGVACVGLSGL